MKYKKGDIALCLTTVSSSYHAIYRGREYVIVKNDNYYIHIECDSKNCIKEKCYWSNTNLDGSAIFRIIEALTPEELARAVSLPSLDDVASFALTLPKPNISEG